MGPPRVEDGLRELERRLLEAMVEAKAVAPAAPRKVTRFLGRALGYAEPSRKGDGDGARYRQLAGWVPPLDELLTSTRPWRAGADPHVAAYAALVDLAAPYRIRHPLVETRGNFGTQHGDPPVDHMYTECRLSAWGAKVLDGRAPNLLVNGAVASARALHFVPHRLDDVVKVLVACLEGADPREASLEPAFPTGGVVSGGHDKLTLSARIELDAEGLVATEVPFGVDVADVVDQIAACLAEGSLPNVRDMQDQSSRDGIRLVFELAPGAQPERVVDELFAQSDLHVSLDIDGLALVDGAPVRLSLAELVEHTLAHLRAAKQTPGASDDEIRHAVIAELHRL